VHHHIKALVEAVEGLWVVVELQPKIGGDRGQAGGHLGDECGRKTRGKEHAQQTYGLSRNTARLLDQSLVLRDQAWSPLHKKLACWHQLYPLRTDRKQRLSQLVVEPIKTTAKRRPRDARRLRGSL